MDNELEKIKVFEKCFAIKLYSQEPATLMLLLSDTLNDFKNRIKIRFDGVISFADMGIIGRQIEYIDISSLGIANRFVAIEMSRDPEEYEQFFFECKPEKGAKRELIIACKTYTIEFPPYSA